MSGYDFLANIYDDYQGFEENHLAHEWANFIERIYKDNARLPENGDAEIYALDLGSGTGQITWELAKCSWNTYGIDNSPAMLNIAWNYDYDSKDEGFTRPVFLLQDMTDFDLGFELDIIYTSLDSFNHLDAESLKLSLERSYESLRTGGVLLFDLHAESYFLEFLNGQEFHDISADYAIYWSSIYDEETQSNHASIDVFESIELDEAYASEQDIESTSNLYERNSFEIVEYFHEATTVVQYLEKLGFSARMLSANDSEFIADWNGQRIFILAIK